MGEEKRKQEASDRQSHLRCQILVLELKCKLKNARIPHTNVTQLFIAIIRHLHLFLLLQKLCKEKLESILTNYHCECSKSPFLSSLQFLIQVSLHELILILYWKFLILSRIRRILSRTKYGMFPLSK